MDHSCAVCEWARCREGFEGIFCYSCNAPWVSVSLFFGNFSQQVFFLCLTSLLNEFDLAVYDSLGVWRRAVRALLSSSSHQFLEMELVLCSSLCLAIALPRVEEVKLGLFSAYCA